MVNLLGSFAVNDRMGIEKHGLSGVLFSRSMKMMSMEMGLLRYLVNHRTDDPGHCMHMDLSLGIGINASSSYTLDKT